MASAQVAYDPSRHAVRTFSEAEQQIEKLEFALAIALGKGDSAAIERLRQRIAELGVSGQEPGT
ncbi:MAG: hypothetical protein ERJ67_05960 [Aphanocapsa feldmannii 277cV]|uniref:Uncharacterized protein n=2 Tax=Aphanocapsa feldmannii TaxID=192050 RepID=A0A524RNC8_9CHRO|nr:MAG: hypothetical protein ERJ69_08955 [Aphanocapsa feldmannii 288cV]TGG92298.1 MAG: hypothetical protein ERJ67_05960 [Aphanocapsa feldmannii 277cV]TGH21460.1 MAG: hypothetical protein ERJ68_05500 [Aphanocapsa feldmannii 277cI]